MQRRSAAGVAALMILAGLVHPAAASTVGPPPACGAWQAIPAKSPTFSNALYSVSGSSATADVWAVGDVSFGTYHTVAQHWNGRWWRGVPTESPGDWSSLTAVRSLSPDDVWAVGRYDNLQLGFTTLAEHWDGRAWSQVPVPTVSGADNWLNGLAFSRSDDGWAVGTANWPDGYSETVTIRWDGHSWTMVPSPNIRLVNAFEAVDALSPSDAWAVGYTRETDGVVLHPFAAHWDGGGWTVTDVPEPPDGYGLLEGVAATQPDDVWAVSDMAVIWHWDGSSWSIVESPSGNETQLHDVVAAGPDDVWAVGSTINRDGLTIPFVERWDGLNWRVAPTPRIYGVLYGVETFADRHVWAVGASGIRALSMHFKEC